MFNLNFQLIASGTVLGTMFFSSTIFITLVIARYSTLAKLIRDSRTQIENKNITFIKNKKNLKPYFEKTDVSITAGGISMFESICSKNITLVTQLYENQKYSIKHLNDLKMITLIGKNNYINQDKLRKIILNLINIKKIKQIKIPKNFKLIDGKSLFRIEKILFKIINKNIG